jgi:hypothetical protein
MATRSCAAVPRAVDLNVLAQCFELSTVRNPTYGKDRLFEKLACYKVMVARPSPLGAISETASVVVRTSTQPPAFQCVQRRHGTVLLATRRQQQEETVAVARTTRGDMLVLMF